MTKADKRIVETYRDHRMVHGVRVSIAKTVADLGADPVEVCKVLGFEPIKFLTETVK